MNNNNNKFLVEFTPSKKRASATSPKTPSQLPSSEGKKTGRKIESKGHPFAGSKVRKKQEREK